MTDEQEKNLSDTVWQWKNKPLKMTFGDMQWLLNALCDYWIEEKVAEDREAKSGNCRACGKYRKGP